MTADRREFIKQCLTRPKRDDKDLVYEYSRRKSGRLDAKKRTFLRGQLARVRAIAMRHRDATTPGARELARIAQWLSDQWQGANNALLEG